MIRPISLTIFATFLGQLLNFLSDLLIAGHFGTSWKADAYFLALVIPVMVSDLIIAGINAVFIPSYVSYEKEGRGEEFFNAFTNVTMLLALVAALLVFISSGWLIGLVGGGFSAEGKELSAGILRILVILILTIPLAGLLSSRLNAHNSFAMPALGKSFYFGSVILALLLFRDVLGIVSVPMGYAAGSLLFIAMLVALIRGAGLRYSFRTDFSHPALKESAVLLAPLVLAALVNYVNILIERSIASGLSEGAISALNYAFKLVNLPVNLFVLSAVTVVVPAFSRLASESEMERLGETLSKGLGLVSFLVVPVVTAMIIFRVPVIQVLFERGEFTGASTMLTSTAVLFYSLGILGLSAVSVLSRVFYALKDMRLFCKISIATSLLNIILVIALTKALGFRGIPIAFASATTLQMFLMLAALGSRHGVPVTKGFLRSALAHSAMALIMAAVCYGAAGLIAEVIDGAAKSSLAFMVALSSCLGALGYFGASLLFRVREAGYIVEKISIKRG